MHAHTHTLARSHTHLYYILYTVTEIWEMSNFTTVWTWLWKNHHRQNLFPQCSNPNQVTMISQCGTGVAMTTSCVTSTTSTTSTMYYFFFTCHHPILLQNCVVFKEVLYLFPWWLSSITEFISADTPRLIDHTQAMGHVRDNCSINDVTYSIHNNCIQMHDADSTAVVCSSTVIKAMKKHTIILVYIFLHTPCISLSFHKYVTPSFSPLHLSLLLSLCAIPNTHSTFPITSLIHSLSLLYTVSQFPSSRTIYKKISPIYCSYILLPSRICYSTVHKYWVCLFTFFTVCYIHTHFLVTMNEKKNFRMVHHHPMMVCGLLGYIDWSRICHTICI